MNQPQQQHRADPHRRLQRHTYQEGPNFLFLATRGGRPPATASCRDLSALCFRARCVRVAREQGISAALALGVSRASLHRWRQRHAAGGLAALMDAQRGPAPRASEVRGRLSSQFARRPSGSSASRGPYHKSCSGRLPSGVLPPIATGDGDADRALTPDAETRVRPRSDRRSVRP